MWRTAELERRKALSTERRLQELEAMVTVLCENCFPSLLELEARVEALDGKYVTIREAAATLD